MWRATTGAVGGFFAVAACGLSPIGEGPPPARDAGTPPVDAPGASDDGPLGSPDGSGDGSGGGPGDATSTDAPGARDATSDVHAETSAGDASSSDTGVLSNAWSLSFDGSATYVDCGAVPIPGDFTIEAWVHPTSFNGETYVLARDERNFGQGQFRFGFLAGGQLFFYMTDATGNDHGLYSGQYNLVSPNAVPSNAWTEVAVTKSAAVFTLFVGGAPAVSVQTSMPFSFGSSMQLPLRIASRVAPNGTSPDGVFAGLIDEVRLWKIARTQAQIQAAMHAEIPSTDPAWSDLQDYWPFDEGSGTATADRSGAHPGTLVGGPSWVTTVPF